VYTASDSGVAVLRLGKTPCWPPMSRIHCRLDKPSFETKTPWKIPWLPLSNVAGQRQAQKMANSNPRRDPRQDLGGHGRAYCVLLSPSSNEQREDAQALLARPYSTPPTHPPPRRAGTCSLDTRELMMRSVTAGRCGASRGKREGQKKRAGVWTHTIMPA
jgi:hypothetical protein